MKTLLLLAAVIGMFSASLASAQTVTTVSARGTVSAYDPSGQLVVTEASGPVTYHYGPSVVYRTSSGVVIPEAEYRTRFVAGAPVRVHYVQQGERRVVQRVVLRDRGDKDDDDDDN
ncbi:hypothetical protein [Brevifollis gellanilyticus]|uniref:DUF5666 domain-containing protein n=1 Tax=Brevifollis gellanilyticus TaxID=748831 RepID=A0A512MAL7_9BACT|nr:hypothetical protein [Brevifollis gellanilyticus]GEP43780.1 hypothetical protein BGE01nite_30710 [Brevifollis gellanilyticus]